MFFWLCFALPTTRGGAARCSSVDLADMSYTPEALMQVAQEAAATATEIVRESHLLPLEIATKSRPNDLVTQVDLASEAAIREVISRHFPEHSILGEEKGLAGESPYCWVVDPIDGTSNFARGFGHYCVSIGLEHHGAGILGVIADPVLGETFYAAKGRGAFKDGKPLKVTEVQELSGAFVAMSYRADPQTLARVNPIWNALGYEVQNLRRLGSTALELTLLASGVIDAFMGFGQGPWDTAAGKVIAREAGAVIKEFDGGQTIVAAATDSLARKLGELATLPI